MSALDHVVAPPSVRRIRRAPTLPPVPVPPPAGWGAPPPRPAAPEPSPAWVGMLMFVGAEAMLFSGLITAFLVYRLGSPLWPPLGEPRFPIAVTSLNTAILLLSAATMHRARRAGRGGAGASRRLLAVTVALGAAFLAVQGSEWARLLAWGLTAASSPYGGIFYLLIGTHGLHVLAAVVTLAVLAGAARRLSRARLDAVSLYWYFVCGVWAVLFPVVYF